MAFKIVVLSCLVAIACGSVIPLEYKSNPQYAYSYGVTDLHTGDIKSQEEVRSGDIVKGSYSLLDADGLKRTVDYSSDPHNGFNAVVHREPVLKAYNTLTIAEPAKIELAAPLLTAAPAISTTVIKSEPLAIAHPEPHLALAAPEPQLLLTKTAAPLALAAPQWSHAAPQLALSAPHLSLAAPHLALAAQKLALSAPHLSLSPPHLSLAAPHLSLAAPHLSLADTHLALASPKLSAPIISAPILAKSPELISVGIPAAYSSPVLTKLAAPALHL